MLNRSPRKGTKWRRDTFEEIMSENFLKPMDDVNPQIQKVQARKIKNESIPRHVVVELQNIAKRKHTNGRRF